MRKLTATTTLAAAVTAATIGLAAPAKATVVETHCPHAITVEEVVCLVCNIAIPVLETATGRDWQCSGS